MRAVLFDLDGTLVERDAALSTAVREVLAARGLPPRPLRKAPAPSTEAPAGRGNMATVADVLLASYPELVEGARDLAAELRTRVLAHIAPCPGALELLEALRGKVRLGLVTNGSVEVQRAKLERVGLGGSFDVLAISDEVGARKPEPEMWAHVLARCECDASEALMVGDDPRTDIDGAGQVGIETCWISRGRTYPTGLRRPDHTCPDVRGVRWLV